MPGPKDWTAHKAELEKLYLKDGKTLQAIRETMRLRGFDASIRAYRMKFEEWDLRKNNYPTVKKRKYQRLQAQFMDNVPSPAQRPTISSEGRQTMSTDSNDPFGHSKWSSPTISWPGNVGNPGDSRIPEEAMDLLPYPGVRVHALLLKWQASSGYLASLQELLVDEETVNGMVELAYLYNICFEEFRNVVKSSIPAVERNLIMKIMYAAILNHGIKPIITSSLWASARHFLLTHDWKRAQRTLMSNEKYEDYWSGAILAMAEWLLSHLDPSSQNPVPCLTCDGLRQDDRRCQYLEVLSNLEERSQECPLKIDRRFYKRALEIAKDAENDAVSNLKTSHQVVLSRLAAVIDGHASQRRKQSCSAQQAELSQRAEIDRLTTELNDCRRQLNLHNSQVTDKLLGVGKVSNSGVSAIDPTTQSSDLAPAGFPESCNMPWFGPHVRGTTLDSDLDLQSPQNLSIEPPSLRYIHCDQESAFDTIYLVWKSSGTPGPQSTFVEAVYGREFFELFIRWISARVSSKASEFLSAVVKEYLHISEIRGVSSFRRLHNFRSPVAEWSRIRHLLHIENGTSRCSPSDPSVVIYPQSALRCFADAWLMSVVELRTLPPYFHWSSLRTMWQQISNDLTRLDVKVDVALIKTGTEIFKKYPSASWFITNKDRLLQQLKPNNTMEKQCLLPMEPGLSQLS